MVTSLATELLQSAQRNLVGTVNNLMLRMKGNSGDEVGEIKSAAHHLYRIHLPWRW